jgi:hypothetical protein
LPCSIFVVHILQDCQVVSQNNFDSLGKALTAILNHKKILKSVASQRFLKSLGLTQKKLETRIPS